METELNGIRTKMQAMLTTFDHCATASIRQCQKHAISFGCVLVKQMGLQHLCLGPETALVPPAIIPPLLPRNVSVHLRRSGCCSQDARSKEQTCDLTLSEWLQPHCMPGSHSPGFGKCTLPSQASSVLMVG